MYCEPEYKVGLFGAFFLFGIVIGCSSVTRLGDTLGRRPIYMLGIVMHLFFMFGIFIVSNYIATYVLTFIFGISVTARYYVGYTYSVEMQPKSHYVMVSTFQFLFESFTALFIAIYFWKISDQYQYLQIPNVLLMIVGFVFLAYMPESPRFKVCIKEYKEAREIFAWIGRVNGLSEQTIKQKLSEIIFEGEDPTQQKAKSMDIEEPEELTTEEDKASKDLEIDVN